MSIGRPYRAEPVRAHTLRATAAPDRTAGPGGRGYRVTEVPMFLLLSAAFADDLSAWVAPEPVVRISDRIPAPAEPAVVALTPREGATLASAPAPRLDRLFRDAWVIQTPGWVTGRDPSVGGLPLDEVPVYIDGVPVGTADMWFRHPAGR